jgi:hypothetical protein
MEYDKGFLTSPYLGLLIFMQHHDEHQEIGPIVLPPNFIPTKLHTQISNINIK